MEDRQRTARAALCVAAGVLWLAVPDEPPPLGNCEAPVESSRREVRPGEWWTESVRCGVGAASPRVRGPARLLFGEPLDLNRAGVAALETLPGIGPSRASAIAAARGERAFERLGDLVRVRGIGPKTVARLEGLLHVVDARSPRTEWNHD